MASPVTTRNYRRLLVSLCVLGLFYPLLDPELRIGYLGLVAWTGVFWIVLYTSLCSVRVGKTERRIARTLLVLAVALGLVALIFGLEQDHQSVLRRALHAGAQFVGLALLLQIFVAVLLDVGARGRVGINKMFGAVCGYVLIGLIFAYVFGLLALLYDDCLVPVGRTIDAPIRKAGMDSLSTRLYFSFVTLTTVGYGDIAPGNSVSRLFATAEALFGQLYLTILVARIVGLHITHSHRIGFDEQSEAESETPTTADSPSEK